MSQVEGSGTIWQEEQVTWGGKRGGREQTLSGWWQYFLEPVKEAADVACQLPATH